MFISSAFVPRSIDALTPRDCRPFSIHSNVCIGDLIAILACGVAGIGFVFWAIHAIRKMRSFPFNARPEDKELQASGDSYHAPSTTDTSPFSRRGVGQTPNLPERVRTRLALSEPEESFYRPSSRTMSSDGYSARDLMTMPPAPQCPPPMGRQSQSPPRRSRRHGSIVRGEAYCEGYGGWSH